MSFSLCCCQSTLHWNIGTIPYKLPSSLHSHCAIWLYWISHGWSHRPITFGVWTRNTSQAIPIWSSWWPKAIGHNTITCCRSTIKPVNLVNTVSATSNKQSHFITSSTRMCHVPVANRKLCNRLNESMFPSTAKYDNLHVAQRLALPVHAVHCIFRVLSRLIAHQSTAIG